MNVNRVGIVFVAALFFVKSVTAQQESVTSQANQSSSTGHTSTIDKLIIPVKVVGGMVFVPVNVNGSDVVLMLDTGATNTVISPAAVHMPVFVGSQTATVTEGHQQVSVAVARLDVRLGKARFDSSVVVLTDLTPAQRTRYGKFDGLLGQNILGQFKSVCLDYEKKLLELER
jgi:predicted aspartyl protease